ncbi:uncharacterized protein EDB93DRAFT_1094011 [Suillus bovinus]|uniref:uncharacterized protein n=1 Tax=Suillus bovinus TaxID=48563 RepID=UPI001B877C53|nr:uncharacterized protein EDB93DRAFT_1094011 [Suillus bovinus]KAG2132307.1 hypothetical protein EDB93DRAFT_1094011 [Suillus bovinus]
MPSTRQEWLVIFFTVIFQLCPAVMAQNDNSSYDHDPILQYRPAFVESLPVQILLTGVVLTLVVVLLLHLLFTAQYHWPLARVNYMLQLTGVVTLLASVTATIYVVFSSNVEESQHWPYMLSYLAVDMPQYGVVVTGNTSDPAVVYAHRWSLVEGATWTVMNATTSMVIQITHIHFLTLLFPSNLEARLIFGLLGPLAIISAIMQLLPIFYGMSSISLAEDTRNVCNAALSLLFTSALIIWGFFVNREAAWRTDGGTSAFGAGAIVLALLSTTLNFIYIPSQDQYGWMPKLMWSVVMWQSFLGWWWWVGSGMGVGEVEELLMKEEKRERKRKLRAQKRKEQREKAKTMWKGVTGAFTTKRDHFESRNSSQGHEGLDNSEPLDVLTSDNALSTAGATAQGSSRGMLPLQFVNRWYARLRHAHLTAARLQAVERVERIHQVFGREETRNTMREPGSQVVGWGLGSYGLRGVERDRREGQGLQITIEVDEDIDNPGKIAEPESLPQDQFFRRRGYQPEPGPSQHNIPAPETDFGWTSFWWWGPLRRWRLRDSTAYR